MSISLKCLEICVAILEDREPTRLARESPYDSISQELRFMMSKSDRARDRDFFDIKLAVEVLVSLVRCSWLH